MASSPHEPSLLRPKACISVFYSKKMKVLESLIGMIQKFPYDDPTYDKLHEDLDRIRGKFKQVGARGRFLLDRGPLAFPRGAGRPLCRWFGGRLCSLSGQ